MLIFNFFNTFIYCYISEMSESDLLAGDNIDGLDGLENGQDGDTVMQCDGVKRDLGEANVDDPELEAIKARVREMEEEAEKLKQLQSEVDKQMNMGSPPGISKFVFSMRKKIIYIYI